MERMRIAIVTDDRMYGEALARSLQIGSRTFDLALYESVEFCLRWQKGGRHYRESFDLVLWDSEDLGRVYGGNLVWLTSRRSLTGEGRPMQEAIQTGAGRPMQVAIQTGEARLVQEAEERGERGAGASDEPRFALYKYSPSQEMVASVFRIYERLTGRRSLQVRPDQIEVFTFLSWQGGCGCTTLSMALGQELTRFYHKKVICISLEGTESAGEYMACPGGMKTAGEYLCHLAGDEPAGTFLESYLIRDSWGLMTFSPSVSCNPLSGAGPGEIRRLLSALMCSGRCDAIVIDAGTGCGDPVREAIRASDRICLVSSREEPTREDRYCRFLSCLSDSEQRLVRVHNELNGGQPYPIEEDRSQTIQITGRRAAGPAGIRRDPEADGIPKVRISRRNSSGRGMILEGAFGKDIHKLAEICYN